MLLIKFLLVCNFLVAFGNDDSHFKGLKEDSIRDISDSKNFSIINNVANNNTKHISEWSFLLNLHSKIIRSNLIFANLYQGTFSVLNDVDCKNFEKECAKIINPYFFDKKGIYTMVVNIQMFNVLFKNFTLFSPENKNYKNTITINHLVETLRSKSDQMLKIFIDRNTHENSRITFEAVNNVDYFWLPIQNWHFYSFKTTYIVCKFDDVSEIFVEPTLKFNEYYDSIIVPNRFFNKIVEKLNFDSVTKMFNCSNKNDLKKTIEIEITFNNAMRTLIMKLEDLQMPHKDNINSCILLIEGKNSNQISVPKTIIYDYDVAFKIDTTISDPNQNPPINIGFSQKKSS